MKLYKSNFLATFISLLAIPFLTVQSQDYLPEKPNPPRLVNDYAGFLSSEENNALEQKLIAYNDSSTSQVAVVIVKSLNGYDVGDFAQRLGQKWGIGQEGKNNGVLIVVKPRYQNEKGEVFIATGYGAEVVLPDLICKRIVDYEIVPSFKNGQFYQGLDKATTAVYSLLRKEFTPDQYLAKNKGKKKNKFPIGLIIIIIIVVVVISRKNSSGKDHFTSGGSSLPFWMLLGMMNSGGSRGGSSFGDFSSGGGSFGGFGGGSFGGGGAGGSW